MERAGVLKTFARMLAGIGLAVAITIGLGGTAAAAPADRAGDAVVLKGSNVASLSGAEPGKIVAFKWSGKWIQVPVQVDERHILDVRQLYPPGNFPPYVGNNDPDFDLEVYSDPKTRAGADPDTGLDANDEVVFMGGDSGAKAPAGVGAPSGVDSKSATVVKVNDPAGGGNAWVYLFKSKMPMNPSAGKDYVDYDFKLTELTEGQTLLNDYSYIGGFNPEDSTVKTKNYELHSIDRWMEDELKITAGNSDGSDILDREVAQATLNACVRSEYTFAGRWQQDSWAGNDGATDNEGTYVTVVDGPVRAIRSYMGANSGPYVQREHIYYADHEQNSVYLRVHVMTDLYSWTDYAPNATGMTYRDAKNTGGVTIDGQPDTLVPTTTADVANGAYSWQQVSGAQGTATTVVGSDTDIPNAAFGNYYLDDSTPSGPGTTQCGGDGQSIGASGFGILGPVTPNTDPRLGAFNNLTVKRTRYFGPPADGVNQAEDYTARVSKPLAGTASAAPMKQARTLIGAKLLNRKVKARPGKRLTLKVKFSNRGNVPISRVKICLASMGVKGGPCKKATAINIGKSRVLTFKAKVRKGVGGKRLLLGFSYSGQAGDFGFTGISTGFAVKLKR